MARPALVVVYDDREVLAALEQALLRRFGADYQIVAADTPAAGLDVLGRLGQAGEQVALVLADQWLQGFIERPGEVNNAISTGTVPYVLFVTFPRVPQGAATRIDEPDPGTCPGL
jgi:hypothetical protein